MTKEVLVVGAGVIGLTSAVCIAEAGHQVRVWAESLPEESTSAAASGLWIPGFAEREAGWSLATYSEFAKLSQNSLETGVHQERGLAVTDMWNEPQPWLAEMPEVKVCSPDELPEGMGLGWWSTVPLVDLPTYLRYLTGRLAAAGVQIERKRISKLGEATDVSPVVVNCTGVGARELAGDEGVTPVRGQHVVVRNPGIDYWYMEGVDTPEWTAFFPHHDKVLLGGVYQPGNWNLEPDMADARGILERCARFEPKLKDVEVIGHTVGLRVGREQARLEEEAVGASRIIHCYGHGPFGVSQSWGSARDVERLVSQTPDAT
ncbi:FAD-dependent oxidoreductase [Streptomyces gobiensis]|uniref:FAD-dependent oxidoreductase n=1 Tax=Streptomyces gobiensis TaxID=2875706 RepID=UPI001E5A30FF|nr:FAD-dependent oxidoreductase [Streptomyces gobiensis]UGY94187.1 FAD-binding oxidoreductase [Streptomyces gobiensis]